MCESLLLPHDPTTLQEHKTQLAAQNECEWYEAQVVAYGVGLFC